MTQLYLDSLSFDELDLMTFDELDNTASISGGLNFDQEYLLEWQASGTNHKVFLDGVEMLDLTNTSRTGNYTWGIKHWGMSEDSGNSQLGPFYNLIEVIGL